MKLTKAEITRINGFFYTDKTLSYHIQTRDLKHYKSLIDKGLVVSTPHSTYAGITLVKLVDDWNYLLETKP